MCNSESTSSVRWDAVTCDVIARSCLTGVGAIASRSCTSWSVVMEIFSGTYM